MTTTYVDPASKFTKNVTDILPTPFTPTLDVLPKAPLPPYGGTITYPRPTAVVAAQSASTEANPNQLAVSIKAVFGKVDINRQLAERSHPGMDLAVAKSLTKSYEYNKTKIVLGDLVDAVPSKNAVTLKKRWWQKSGLDNFKVAKVHKAVLKAVCKLEQPQNAVIIIHPRTAAVLGAKAGRDGLALTIFDTVVGNDILVFDPKDVLLFEDDARQFTFEELLSVRAEIRLQLLSYVATAIQNEDDLALVTGSYLEIN